MKQLMFAFLILITSFFLVSSANAQDTETIKVTNDLYIITGLGGNIGFLVTNKGVLVVDAGTQGNHGTIINEKIKEITDSEIKYVVLTHYHFDHTGGLQTLGEGNINIIGHENTVKNIKNNNVPTLKDRIEKDFPDRIAGFEKRIKEEKEDTEDLEYKLAIAKENLQILKEIEFVYPNISFKEEITITLGKDTITIFNPGNAHTDGNTIVWFKNKKAIHMGDMLFHKNHPFVDWNANANTENWMKYLKQIAALDIDYVIPGHGEITDKSALYLKIEYLKRIRAMIKKHINDGFSLEEIKKEITSEQFEGIGLERILPRTIEGIYREMTEDN